MYYNSVMINFRNLAKSTEVINIFGSSVSQTDWTVQKAVKDGYTACGWAYKAVNLISRNAATVPFVVKNKDNEIQWDHPITKLLLKPIPFLNRLQFYELIYQWLQLTGNAYINKISGSRTIAELFPISPDKITPKESTNNFQFIDGYSLIKNGMSNKGISFNPDEIIHFRLLDPSNPVLGISPLKAAAKAIDLDVAQQKWNTGTMQNRGVVDSVFTFDKQLERSEGDSIKARIMEKFSSVFGRREPLILGSNAKYTRLSLTPVEVDFINSRKFNMSEIFIIFGVPPQLGGSEEASTYNNFSASFRIFWETTLIPMINMCATQFTSSFAEQLEDGYYISPDYSDITALRDSEDEKAKIVATYYKTGVPISQLNEKFEIGFTDYDGWDKPFNGLQKQPTEDMVERSHWRLIPIEKRNLAGEMARRDKIAEGTVKDVFTAFLSAQKQDVITAINAGSDPMDTVAKRKDELHKLILDVAYGVSNEFSKTVITDARGNPPNFEKRGAEEDALMAEYYAGSDYILTEVSEIQQSTVEAILAQVREATDKNWTVQELVLAIEDTGIFSPERALRIARTEVGTAASIGQMVSGRVAGAKKKTWQTGGFDIRNIHTAREGETVGIDDRFSIQSGSTGPRFPSDHQISADDRINCKCFMTFE